MSEVANISITLQYFEFYFFYITFFIFALKIFISALKIIYQKINQLKLNSNCFFVELNKNFFHSLFWEFQFKYQIKFVNN